MRKNLSIVLAVLMLVFVQMMSFAATETNTDIPKAAGAPTIDGKIGEKEWEGAEIVVLDKNSPQVNGWPENGGDVVSTNYMMWNEDGLYGAAVAENDTTPALASDSTTPLNTVDAMQICIVEFGDAGVYWWDFAPSSNFGDNGAICYEHSVYAGDAGSVGVIQEGIREDNKYMVEYFIPWTAMASSGYDAVAGNKIRMLFTVMDFPEAGQPITYGFSNTSDLGSGQIEMTLSDKTAGTKNNPKTGVLSVVPLIAVATFAGVAMKKTLKR